MTEVVAGLWLAWAVIGATTAVVMVRRGHDAVTWAVLGFVLGPVSPFAAVTAVRREASTAVLLSEGEDARGPVDVLVGIDGSREATAALRAALALHRWSVGRLVLATVVPHEADLDPDLALALSTAARSVDEVRPTTAVLHGEPAAALARYAVDGGFEVLVVGARGRGRSSSPLGSVALRLASGAGVPVLIGPAPVATTR